jgi:hypothetical protein
VRFSSSPSCVGLVALLFSMPWMAVGGRSGRPAARSRLLARVKVEVQRPLAGAGCLSIRAVDPISSRPNIAKPQTDKVGTKVGAWHEALP